MVSSEIDNKINDAKEKINLYLARHSNTLNALDVYNESMRNIKYNKSKTLETLNVDENDTLNLNFKNKIMRNNFNTLNTTLTNLEFHTESVAQFEITPSNKLSPKNNLIFNVNEHSSEDLSDIAEGIADFNIEVQTPSSVTPKALLDNLKTNNYTTIYSRDSELENKKQSLKSNENNNISDIRAKKSRENTFSFDKNNIEQIKEIISNNQIFKTKKNEFVIEENNLDVIKTESNDLFLDEGNLELEISHLSQFLDENEEEEKLVLKNSTPISPHTENNDNDSFYINEIIKCSKKQSKEIEEANLMNPHNSRADLHINFISPIKQMAAESPFANNSLDTKETKKRVTFSDVKQIIRYEDESDVKKLYLINQDGSLKKHKKEPFDYKKIKNRKKPKSILTKKNYPQAEDEKALALEKLNNLINEVEKEKEIEESERKETERSCSKSKNKICKYC